MGFAMGASGCLDASVRINDRDEYLAEATRAYPKENKERVIHAAETVLKTSDPKFDFRYTGAGFVGLRRYFIYAVVVANAGQEKWEFATEDKGGAVVASLSVSDEGTTASGYSAQHYDAVKNAIPLYRLFWKRMDYMLGKRADWVTCEDEGTALQTAGISPIDALSGLCGLTSSGRSAPAPDPLGKNSVKPSQRVLPGDRIEGSPVSQN